MNNTKLINQILKYRDDRDWKQFHSIKDLLIGLNIEVSELQDCFLWKTDKEIESLSNLEEIKDELGDIFILLTFICDTFKIDLEEAVASKLEKNTEKYPVSKSKGSNKKYNKY